MKLLFTQIAALLLFLAISACISVPMAPIAIPEHRNAFSAAVFLGTNGLGFHPAYSPDGRWVLDLGGNAKFSPIAPHTLSAEAGCSWVAPGKRVMLSASYGGGSFLLKPNLSGSDYALNNISGKLNKASLGFNARMTDRIGVAFRCSRSWVHAFAEYNRPEYNFSGDYQVQLGMEAVLYFYLNARKTVLLCTGSGAAAISTIGRTKFKPWEDIIYPMPVFITAGYVFKTRAGN